MLPVFSDARQLEAAQNNPKSQMALRRAQKSAQAMSGAPGRRWPVPHPSVAPRIRFAGHRTWNSPLPCRPDEEKSSCPFLGSQPRHAQYFRLIHDMSPAPVLFHTCGSVVDILPDLVEIGVDVLHPLQVTAKGMDPVALKAEWGAELAFWGAIDTQRTLCRGTPEEVRAEAHRAIEICRDNSSLVLFISNTITPDVPLENVIAMYEAVRE